MPLLDNLLVMEKTEQWSLAVSLDVNATDLLRQRKYAEAHIGFMTAFYRYKNAWDSSPSPQLLFEFAGFCWCLLECGIPKIVTSEGLFQRCDQTCFELLSFGADKYKSDKHILFLQKYIHSRNGGDATEGDILTTVDFANPADVPYFLLFLLSNKQRYADNAKLLWKKCTKEITLFNRLIISLIEYDCDPKLME